MSINVNMTKKDLFNARSASRSIKDALGVPLIVTGCAVVEGAGTDKAGNACDVGYIATDHGVFGFTSNVILKGMADFAEYLEETMNDGDIVTIEFFVGKTNSGTDFYNFQLD